jgi:hypothetical protein
MEPSAIYRGTSTLRKMSMLLLNLPVSPLGYPEVSPSPTCQTQSTRTPMREHREYTGSQPPNAKTVKHPHIRQQSNIPTFRSFNWWRHDPLIGSLWHSWVIKTLGDWKVVRSPMGPCWIDPPLRPGSSWIVYRRGANQSSMMRILKNSTRHDPLFALRLQYWHSCPYLVFFIQKLWISPQCPKKKMDSCLSPCRLWTQESRSGGHEQIGYHIQKGLLSLSCSERSEHIDRKKVSLVSDDQGWINYSLSDYWHNVFSSCAKHPLSREREKD